MGAPLRAVIARSSTLAEHELRDIDKYGELSSSDLRYLQAKISAAGEMKTAIKRYLDAHAPRRCEHVERLEQTMVDYLNVEPGAFGDLLGGMQRKLEWARTGLVALTLICTCGSDSDAHDEECVRSVAQTCLEKSG